jgi:hypothetical protein
MKKLLLNSLILPPKLDMVDSKLLKKKPNSSEEPLLKFINNNNDYDYKPF